MSNTVDSDVLTINNVLYFEPILYMLSCCGNYSFDHQVYIKPHLKIVPQKLHLLLLE